MEFFDAEFCNTIMLKTDAVVDMSLKDACHIVNEVLTKAGFEGQLLKVGKLKDLGDEFDLGKILVRKDYHITLRFNTFSDALKAH